MARLWLYRVLFFGFAFLPFAIQANAEHIPVRWQKEYPQGVEWFVRTSPGILIVRSGKSLSALDGEDGRELWSLPEVEGYKSSYWLPDDMFQREKNVMEIPGMGILLLNEIRLPGMQEPRLVALNLVTGTRLWDKEPLEGLCMVAPLAGSTDVILVSMRHRLGVKPIKERFWNDLLLTPRHYTLRRTNSLTGEVKWTFEYPEKFWISSASLHTFGGYLIFQTGNDFVGCINASNGKPVWEREQKATLNEVSLPLVGAGGNVIFAMKFPEAMSPVNPHTRWQKEGLGRITGLLEVNGTVFLAGERAVTAVDPKTGSENWSHRAPGARTNLVYDKTSDAIMYSDKKAIHVLDPDTGIARKEIRLPPTIHPTQIAHPSPDFVVAYTKREYAIFHLATGEHVKAEGKLRDIFTPYRFVDFWPIVSSIQMDTVYNMAVLPEVRPRPAVDWDFIQTATLLPGSYWKRLIPSATLPEGFGEAYLTVDEKGIIRITTFDADRSKLYQIISVDSQIDVSTALGLTISVTGKSLRAWELPKE